MENEAVSASLQHLPTHILQEILMQRTLDAQDLASLESSCCTFRAAVGILPNRFKSLAEVVAFHKCQLDPLFLGMPSQVRLSLLLRFGGSWKFILSFLEAIQLGEGNIGTKDMHQVVGGKYHTLVLGQEGQVKAFGSGQYGILGQGLETTVCRSPTLVPLPPNVHVKHIAGSHNHVAFTTDTGEVFSYGDNSSSCCGHGSIEGVIGRPSKVASMVGTQCKKVSTGLSFTLILTDGGHVYSCGSNVHGQLGHGDFNDKPTPEEIEGLSSVVTMSSGTNYTLAVTQDGCLFSFGYGANYCLGHGDFANETRPRLVNPFMEKNVHLLVAAAGDEHSAAISSTGQVFTWGKGYCGALGHGNDDDEPIPKVVNRLDTFIAVQVAVRKRKTFVVGLNGSVLSFGWMGFGSLGLTGRGASDNVHSPDLVVGLSKQKIAQISCGTYHTIASSKTGTVFVFGDNEKGQLGLDDVVACTEPKKLVTNTTT